MTDATVTSAPHRVNVSVIQVVSISSLPSPMGTRIRLDMSRAVDVENRREVPGNAAAVGWKEWTTRAGVKAKRVAARMRAIRTSFPEFLFCGRRTLPGSTLHLEVG